MAKTIDELKAARRAAKDLRKAEGREALKALVAEFEKNPLAQLSVTDEALSDAAKEAGFAVSGNHHGWVVMVPD